MSQFLGFRVQKSKTTGPYVNTGVIFQDEVKAMAYCSDNNMSGMGFVSYRYIEEYLEYYDDKFDLDPEVRFVYNQFSGSIVPLSEYNEYMKNFGF